MLGEPLVMRTLLLEGLWDGESLGMVSIGAVAFDSRLGVSFVDGVMLGEPVKVPTCPSGKKTNLINDGTHAKDQRNRKYHNHL